MFYSPTTRSFYSLEINGANMPGDVVEISQEYHAQVLAGEAAGMVIISDEEGKPVLTQPPPPSQEAVAAIERVWRDLQLKSAEWVASRHRDELDMQLHTTLTVEQFAQLLQFRQQLRDWPADDDFPLIEHRPTPPEWLVDQLT